MYSESAILMSNVKFENLIDIRVRIKIRFGLDTVRDTRRASDANQKRKGKLRIYDSRSIFLIPNAVFQQKLDARRVIFYSSEVTLTTD
jgi:hypothetical protein